jgi:hypothetical protein
MNTDTERRLSPGKQTPQSVTRPASAKTTFGPALICVYLCSSVVELNRYGFDLALSRQIKTAHDARSRAVLRFQ